MASLFVSLLSHLQPARAQDSNSSANSLRGTVINSVTREPIARALVYSNDNRFGILTDDEGRFEFEYSAPAQSPAQASTTSFRTSPFDRSIQLTARKPGFLESENAYQFQITASDGITIPLVPEALIVGRVNLPSANQSDRITVEIYKRYVREGRPYWTPISSVSTRSNGEFRFAGLAPGTYKIFTSELDDHDPITFDPRGQQYGYPPIFYPAASDFDSASPIILEAGKTFQVELSPVLQPYYPVKIAVTNVAAQGGGAEVSVALQGHKGPGYSLGYEGDQGITGLLPNGIYTVEATLQQGPQTLTGTTKISVKGAPVIHATLAAIPNGSIPVNIKDETAQATPAGFLNRGELSRVQKANVYLTPADDFDTVGAAARSLPRNPNDDLLLENVRPGRYWLRVEAFFGYVASAVAGDVDLLRQPLVVGPGGASLPIEIVLRDDSATIDGTVEGLPSSPGGAGSGRSFTSSIAPSAGYVYCIPLPDSAGRSGAGYISPEGRFHIPELPPGSYRLLAFDRSQGELEYQNAEAMEAYDDKGTVVRLSPGQTEQVRVPLIRSKE